MENHTQQRSDDGSNSNAGEEKELEEKKRKLAWSIAGPLFGLLFLIIVWGIGLTIYRHFKRVTQRNMARAGIRDWHNVPEPGLGPMPPGQMLMPQAQIVSPIQPIKTQNVQQQNTQQPAPTALPPPPRPV